MLARRRIAPPNLLGAPDNGSPAATPRSFSVRRRRLVLGGLAARARRARRAWPVAFKGTFSDEFKVPGTESQRGDRADRAQRAAGQRRRRDRPRGLRRAARASSSTRRRSSSRQALAGVPRRRFGRPTRPTGIVSKDGRIAYTDLQFSIAQADVGRGADRRDRGRRPADAAPQVEYGGSAAAIESEPPIGEVLGVIVAMLVLTITFGSLLAAGLPLLTALSASASACSASSSRAASPTSPRPSITLAAMLGLAVGIDYALFILSRHRTQVRDGHGDRGVDRARRRHRRQRRRLRRLDGHHRARRAGRDRRRRSWPRWASPPPARSRSRCCSASRSSPRCSPSRGARMRRAARRSPPRRRRTPSRRWAPAGSPSSCAARVIASGAVVRRARRARDPGARRAPRPAQRRHGEPGHHRSARPTTSSPTASASASTASSRSSSEGGDPRRPPRSTLADAARRRRRLARPGHPRQGPRADLRHARPAARRRRRPRTSSTPSATRDFDAAQVLVTGQTATNIDVSQRCPTA